ncbi:MAG: histidine kinase [Nitrospinae bacterium]|nr:histidine kinase [Nitrospinota bacterium]
MYYELEDIVITSIDSHLHNEVQMIAGLLRAEESDIEHELSEVAVGEYAVPLSGHYYQIVSPDKRIIASSPSLSVVGASLSIIKGSSEPSYMTIIGPERNPLRLMTQSFIVSNKTYTIQAADSLEDSYKILSSFKKIILIVFPSIFIIFVIGILVITGLSLKPLDYFSRKVGQITEMNLNERIDEQGIDMELQPLAASFNTMLGRLEESFLRQSQFMADASHDLKTPASVIKSYCDVTLGRDRTESEYKEALGKISEMVDRISNIISRILEISRLESKTFSLNIVGIDLMDIMKDVLKLLEPSASASGIKINLSGQRVNISGDRERLTEAFINIADNAIKYNKKDGSVDIVVGDKNGEALVTVMDTGIGIPEKGREKIFDRFHRIDESRSVVAGSGLGLSIVRAIIKAHGGRIEVESEIGKWSRFIIFLPSKKNRSVTSFL